MSTTERIAIRDRQRKLATAIENANSYSMTEDVVEARRVRDDLILAAEQLPTVVEQYQEYRG
jgi:hypothetical protein